MNKAILLLVGFSVYLIFVSLPAQATPIPTLTWKADSDVPYALYSDATFNTLLVGTIAGGDYVQLIRSGPDGIIEPVDPGNVAGYYVASTDVLFDEAWIGEAQGPTTTGQFSTVETYDSTASFIGEKIIIRFWDDYKANLSSSSRYGESVEYTLTAGDATFNMLDSSQGGVDSDAWTSNAIPEPGSLLLMGMGILGLVSGFRKQRIRRQTTV